MNCRRVDIARSYLIMLPRGRRHLAFSNVSQKQKNAAQSGTSARGQKRTFYLSHQLVRDEKKEAPTKTMAASSKGKGDLARDASANGGFPTRA